MRRAARSHICRIGLIGLLSPIFFYSASFSQTKYWIEFKDKNITASQFKPGNQLFDSVLKQFSPKALQRRVAALGKKNSAETISLEDAPLSKKYLDSLVSFGVKPEAISLWQNALSAYLTDSQFMQLKKLSFISRISILPKAKKNTESIQEVCSVFLPSSHDDSDVPEVLPIPPGYDSIIYHYGNSDEFLHRIDVPPLHAMGFDGSGIILGYLDVGFRWRAMNALKMHHVIAEYDFIFHDSLTANDSLDDPNQDGHGSAVLSIATGFLPDSLIGPAYNPDLLLAKTEDVRSERPVEEDNYAAAMEWMEKLGVDITSSSVGYFNFDSGFTSHTYADMNGKTTVSAKACARAAKLGVLVCTAMGNGGTTGYPYMITPADADSIISVGALDVNDTIAGFSSRGPTYDGRLKPEISAPGVNDWFETTDDILKQGTGTSFATPMTSGACALIKQAHPEASAQAIRAAIMQTGIRWPGHAPDTAYGYGRLDAYQAALRLGTIIGTVREWRVDSIHHLEVGIAANNRIKSAVVHYTYNSIGSILPLTFAADSLIYFATFPALPKGTHIQYYIEAKDGADTSTFYPRNAPDSTLDFYIGDTIITHSAVSDNAQISELRLSPNPAHDVLDIRVKTDEVVSYVITDALGRNMLSYDAAPNREELKIRLDKFPAGAYDLHAQSKSGNFVKNMKFIIIP